MAKYNFNEFDALQCSCSSINGLAVERYCETNGRKTIKMFFVTFNGEKISPVLNYKG